MVRSSLLLACLVLAPTLVVHAADFDPAAIQRALDAATLDMSKAQQVTQASRTLGPAKLLFDDGVIVPTTPVGGLVLEAVFVGKGRLVYEPPDAIERGQLELFSKKTKLDEPFEIAVLAGPGLQIAGLGSGTAATLDADKQSKVAAKWNEWKDGVVRKPQRVVPKLVHSLSGETRRSATAYFQVSSTPLENLLLVLDPDESEPFRLLQYRPITYSEWEKMQISYATRKDRQAGWYRARDLDRAAEWKTWGSVPIATTPGVSCAAGPGLEATHYDVAVTLQPDGIKISGALRTTLVPRCPSVRVASGSVYSNLVITAVRSATGSPLHFDQMGSEFSIVLDRAYDVGEQTVVELDFEGPLFDKPTRRLQNAVVTTVWCPFFQAVEYTDKVPSQLFQATFRIPKNKQLFCGGQLIESGADETTRWEKRVSHGPGLGLFFELGALESYSFEAKGFEISVTYDSVSAPLKSDRRDKLKEDVTTVVDWLTETLGPYPYRRLDIMMARHDYGQAIAGAIILPESFFTSNEDPTKYGGGDYRIFLAYELARQWWGGAISLRSVHDRWLAEGMCTFLSQLYGRQVLREKLGLQFTPMTKEWREALDKSTSAGRPVEAIGPIVLSDRLDSPLCPDCDEQIVSTKGALVLEMLSNHIGPAKFLKMLHEIAARWVGRSLDTTAFFSAIEKMSGADLAWFRQRYVYGTGFPILNYRYSFAAVAKGGWDVLVEIEQEPTYDLTPIFQLRGEHGLDVAYLRHDRVDVGEVPLVVPWAIRVYNPAEPYKGKQKIKGEPTREQKSNWKLSGRVLVPAKTHKFIVHVDFEPLEFVLDPDEITLVEPNCETCAPKWRYRVRGARAAHASDFARAESFLKTALEVPIDSEVPGGKDDDLTSMERRRNTDNENAAVYFVWSEMELDRGDEPRAQEMLQKGKGLLESHAATWLKNFANFVEARLLLRNERPKVAYQLLWLSTQDGKDNTHETHMLMAIAAKQLGDKAALDRELKLLREREIDVSLLEASPQ